MDINKDTTPTQSIIQHVSEAISALNYLVDELNNDQAQIVLCVANHLTGIINEATKIEHEGNNAPSATFLITDNSELLTDPDNSK